MHTDRPRNGVLAIGVPIVTLVFILAAIVFPHTVGAIEPYLVLGLMLLFGLPHGATDRGLFAALGGGELPQREFYFLYGGVIAAYGLVWWLFPAVAFGLFLLLSVYHFGQSNWADVEYERPWVGRIQYLVWGAGVLFTPVLLYAGESAAIVGQMTGGVVSVPGSGWIASIIGSLAVLNLLFPLLLAGTGTIGWRRVAYEYLAYGLLTALFFSNSLLLGFTVYFVFWHSLGSAHDQLLFFRGRITDRQRRHLLGEIAATTLGAVVFCLVIWLGIEPAAALSKEVIGGVFVFISLLTLPHMLLVDQLYRTLWGRAAAPFSSFTSIHHDGY